jgi:UDP-4-amino-4,6-dideoxy-N-acetyl-beta-L-altrosamine N-acetyltransferase
MATHAGRVRPMAAEDLERVLAWRNHPEVRRYMYTTQKIPLEEHRLWFERALQDQGRLLLIFELEGQPRGYVQITGISPGGIGDWGFYVAPDAGKGTGRALGNTALNYAFNELGLHKVCGRALDYNERSIRFHRALGFKQEGVLRDQHFDGVRYHDVVCFGLLHDEWPRTSLES